MARELRIGRPDLPRYYDDGGLVDLNSAPAEAIAGICQIPLSVAEQITAARDVVGRFGSVTEALVDARLIGDAADIIADRALVLPAP